MVQNISQKSATSAQDCCERFLIEKTHPRFARLRRANVSSSAYPPLAIYRPAQTHEPGLAHQPVNLERHRRCVRLGRHSLDRRDRLQRRRAAHHGSRLLRLARSGVAVGLPPVLPGPRRCHGTYRATARANALAAGGPRHSRPARAVSEGAGQARLRLCRRKNPGEVRDRPSRQRQGARRGVRPGASGRTPPAYPGRGRHRPALAIGSAKELVEATAKTILDGRGIIDGKSDDLPKLAKAAFGALRQLPDEVPDAAKGAEIIKRTLSNLAWVVQGLAEIRGLYGTGHGCNGATRGISPRHARLAVGAAATLATYLLDTHKETPLPSPRNGAT